MRKGEQGGGDPPPTYLTPYLSCGEEGQSELDQPLGLDLHGGERALEDGESLRGGGGIIRAHHPASPHPEGLCAPPYLLEGVAEALLAVQVVVSHLCEANETAKQCEPPQGVKSSVGGGAQRKARPP